MNVLNATELLNLKWLILCYMNLNSKRKQNKTEVRQKLVIVPYFMGCFVHMPHAEKSVRMPIKFIAMIAWLAIA